VKYEKVYGSRWHFNVVEQLHNGGKVEKFVICCTTTSLQTRSSNDWFWRVQTFFLVFEGRKLPLKTLKLFYKLDQGCFAHNQSHGG
jgi:hypothetical protein